eukprot:1108262-Prymnesium_polylepis.1
MRTAPSFEITRSTLAPKVTLTCFEMASGSAWVPPRTRNALSAPSELQPRNESRTTRPSFERTMGYRADAVVCKSSSGQCGATDSAPQHSPARAASASIFSPATASSAARSDGRPRSSSVELLNRKGPAGPRKTVAFEPACSACL